MGERTRKFTTESIFKDAVKIIEKDSSIYFVADVWAALGISDQSWYNHIKFGSPESEEIKRLINQNRINAKKEIRSNLRYNADNPTAQLSLYRMIATPEERDAIATTTKADITSGGKEIGPISIEIIDSRIKKEDKDGTD